MQEMNLLQDHASISTERVMGRGIARKGTMRRSDAMNAIREYPRDVHISAGTALTVRLPTRDIRSLPNIYYFIQ